jgi:hypothetical protein
MARKEVLIDDLDGHTEGAPTIEFAFDGQAYEIDLAAANAEKVAKMLAPVIAKAREVTKKGAAPNGESVAVRLWAKQQGVELSAKGKVPKTVVEQYRSWKAEQAGQKAVQAPTQ